MRKRRRKKRYFLRAMLFLLAAALVAAGFYLYPAWRAAKALQDKMGLPYGSFEMELELDREELSQGQEKMLGTLARLTGIQEEAMYRLSIRGKIQEDKAHLKIYPDGRTEPLVELYLGNDTNVINETMLYNAIRTNLTEQFGLLKFLMPAQEETLYISLEQVEQLFGIDLSGLHGFDLSALTRKIRAEEYFLVLAVMSRERQGERYRFALDTGQAGLGFEVQAGTGYEAVGIELEVPDLPKALAHGRKLSSLLGSWKPGEELKIVKSFSMALTWSEDGTITIPTNLVDQGTIETISGIRAWIQETFG